LEKPRGAGWNWWGLTKALGESSLLPHVASSLPFFLSVDFPPVFQTFLWSRYLDLKHSGIAILPHFCLEDNYRQRSVNKIHAQMDYMGKSWGKLTVMQNPLCENPPGKMTFRIFYEYPETSLN